VAPLPLFINRDVDYDWLIALAFGQVLDGQPDDHRIGAGEDAAWILDRPGGEIVGFAIQRLNEFDADAADSLWTGPHFAAPTLGLADASAGEIAAASQARFARSSTLNRRFFDAAIGSEGVEAARAWMACVETGDSMAHYGLGYTLVELGRYHEAYAHLRFYTELAPFNGWAWCWLGQAAAGLGTRDEARAAYARALDLEEAGGFETDASEMLADLTP
jgi:tetratricopeptide (TPR) repeat protein